MLSPWLVCLARGHVAVGDVAGYVDCRRCGIFLRRTETPRRSLTAAEIETQRQQGWPDAPFWRSVYGPQILIVLSLVLVSACSGSSPMAPSGPSVTVTPAPTVVIPAARLTSDGTPARVLVTPTDLEHVGFNVDAHNQGAGCAADVDWSLALADNNGLVLDTLRGRFPTTRLVQPGEAFTVTSCCASSETVLSSKTYRLAFTFDSVPCS